MFVLFDLTGNRNSKFDVIADDFFVLIRIDYNVADSKP